MHLFREMLPTLHLQIPPVISPCALPSRRSHSNRAFTPPTSRAIPITSRAPLSSTSMSASQSLVCQRIPRLFPSLQAPQLPPPSLSPRPATPPAPLVLHVRPTAFLA